MPTPEEHAARRVRLATAAALDAARRWARVDPDNIARSWTAQIPATVAVLSAAQLAAAGQAEEYLDEFAEPAGEVVDPRGYAGVASDGGGLASLLYQPAIGALMTIGSGGSTTRGLASGAASLDMIVRTQVADAGRAADQAALTARPQLQGYVRQIVGATCARCTILAGRFYRWNAGFQRHPRCLPPGVVVSGPERLATTRRWFKGELRVIRTAGGQELPITGNHPVLTDQGWIPANLVQPGDNLVRGEFGHDARPLVVPDKYEAPAKVEDLWCPDRMLALRSVPTAPEDFHGDGLHGEVDVVLPDGLLGYRGLVPGLKPAAEALLRRGVEAATGLSGDGPPHQVVEGLLAAAYGVMRRFRLVESVARGHLAGAYGPSLGHGPDLDAGQFETTPDHVTAQAVAKGERILTSACNVLGYDLWRDEDLSPRWDAPAGPFSVETRGAYAGIGVDLLRRFAGQVHLDRVVENVTTQWAGHVYNLTSSEGWYSANGLIVSNCDCTHVPANREQWRQSARFHDPRQVYDSLSVAERQRAGWSLADQRAIAEGADLTFVTNMKGVTTAGTRRSAGRMTTDQIYKRAGGDRDEAIRLLRQNGYLTGAPVLSSRRSLTLAAVEDTARLARMTVPQLRDLARQRGLTGLSRARKADLIQALGGKTAAKATTGLESMTVAQLRAEAKRLGVRIPAGARKADILNLVRGGGGSATAKVTAAAKTAEQMTVAELRALAKANNISLASGLKKADIIEHIRFWELGVGRSILPGAAITRGTAFTSQRTNWWDDVTQDTGLEASRPVRGLRVSAADPSRAAPEYLLDGSLWRIDGVAYLVEHSTHPLVLAEELRNARTVVEQLIELTRSLPASQAAAQRSFIWMRGPNPFDAYWEQQYGIPGFRSLATAGTGVTKVWGRSRFERPRPIFESLRHEFGHNVDNRSRALGLDSGSFAWTSAAQADVGFAVHVSDFRPNRAADDGHPIAFRPDASKKYPNGVTSYGKSSPAEDWAESVRMYLLGELGQGRITGGSVGPIYFRDIFPARAKILDQLFPDVAAEQRRALARRR